MRRVDYEDQQLGAPADYLRGEWAERDWRNVPGPFYCAGTDNCLTGRTIAPEHVIYEDDHYPEVVYCQPRNPHEVRLVLSAAYDDPYSGYSCDGDEHWTLHLVREWWSQRHRLLAWIDTACRNAFSGTDPTDLDAAAGLCDYAKYVTGGLETDLREYGFWLERRRAPEPHEALPAIAQP